MLSLRSEIDFLTPGVVRGTTPVAGRDSGGVMASQEKRSEDELNMQEVIELLERFERSSLAEMSVKIGTNEVAFKRAVAVAPAGGPPLVHPHLQPPSHPVSSQEEAGQGAGRDPGVEVITSPIVGTFYRAPAPDAPPFVEEGTRVQKGQTLAIIEAMKLMNELEAEYDCEIVAVLVENAGMVEFGTPLFEVRRL